MTFNCRKVTLTNLKKQNLSKSAFLIYVTDKKPKKVIVMTFSVKSVTFHTFFNFVCPPEGVASTMDDIEPFFIAPYWSVRVCVCVCDV